MPSIRLTLNPVTPSPSFPSPGQHLGCRWALSFSFFAHSQCPPRPDSQWQPPQFAFVALTWVPRSFVRSLKTRHKLPTFLHPLPYFLLYIRIYICVCICMCVCVFVWVYIYSAVRSCAWNIITYCALSLLALPLLVDDGAQWRPLFRAAPSPSIMLLLFVICCAYTYTHTHLHTYLSN